MTAAWWITGSATAAVSRSSALPAAAVLGLLIGLSLSPPGTRTVLAGLCGVIPTLLVPHVLGQRLGGHTGDSYGACVEWTEAFTLWSGWLMLRLLS